MIPHERKPGPFSRPVRATSNINFNDTDRPWELVWGLSPHLTVTKDLPKTEEVRLMSLFVFIFGGKKKKEKKKKQEHQ